MTDWTKRARGLADTLRDEGAITGPAWHAAFAATRRHVFVPRFYQMDQYNSPRTLIEGDDAEHRDTWLEAVYANQVLITDYQVAGHHEDGAEIRSPTSSASQPSIVAVMLDRLDVHDGQKVLEIGTGTGYNTALLCHRLGDTNVTSIDIAPRYVAEATHRLADLDLYPRLVSGDGASGVPQAAPYHRILATCAIAGVPAAWIEQLADGGLIVAPLNFAGALAKLVKTAADEVSGPLDASQAWFMPLRPAGTTGMDGIALDLPDPPTPAYAHERTSEVDPEALQDPDFQLWLRLQLPEGRLVPLVSEDMATVTGMVLHTADHRADFTAETGRVVQDERRLWDAVELAWRAWLRHDRPRRERIGITARADGTQRAWLDSTDSGVSWPLPT
ncbi:MAG: methyltransferase domain-containing protein [Micromonosporaceae bacterium]